MKNKRDNSFHMKNFRSERGAITIGGIILMIILAICIYVGFKMGSPIVENFQVKKMFRFEATRLKNTDKDEVMSSVEKKLKDMKIKIEEDTLEIVFTDRGAGMPYIKAEYYRRVVFPKGYTYTYHFKPVGEASTF